MDIFELVLLVVVILNFVCFDVFVLLIWGIDVLLFIVLLIVGDCLGLWVIVVDVLFMGGVLFVCGFRVFVCGFMDICGFGGKLKV